MTYGLEIPGEERAAVERLFQRIHDADERIELTAEWLDLEPGPKIDIYFGPSYVDEHQDRFDHNIGGLASRMDGHVTVYTTMTVGSSLGTEGPHTGSPKAPPYRRTPRAPPWVNLQPSRVGCTRRSHTMRSSH